MTILIGSVDELDIDSGRIAAFYSENWQRRIALTQPTFYEWQFKSLPTAIGVDHCVVAYDSQKDTIAGVMGLHERPFHLCGNQLHAAELTTWVVAEAYRKVGAGARILSHIQTTYDALIGMGISAAALPVYMRAGFRYLSAIPRFVRVYNYDAVARVGRCEPLAKKLASRWAELGSSPYVAKEWSGYEASQLFERLTSSYNFYSRDSRHLTWRYQSHPAFRYRMFTVQSSAASSEEAFIALRIESVLSDLTICHIMDCIGDESALSAAFAWIDDFCSQNRVDVADLFCTSARLNSYPLSRGWFSVIDDKYMAFPHLFHPLEVRIPPTTSLIYWAKTDFQAMCDLSRLYVTKQDADLDRPTLEGD